MSSCVRDSLHLDETMAATASDGAPADPHGVTGRLCIWVHDLQLSDVPSETVTRAKHLILDGLGCAIVASHLPWSETAAKGVFSMEGEGPCSLIGWGDKKLPALSAAVLNSAFIQGFELDDYHSVAPVHSAAVLVPALLAAAELVASRDEPIASHALSGDAFLKAFIVGCEVGPRVGLGLHGADLLTRGWHSGAVQGPSASAAAISSLLKLPPNQIEWALGMATTQSGGLMSAQYGSMAKRMQHGFGSRSGLFAALMARQGYTGIEKVFETPYGGFLSVFSQGANFEPKCLPDELVAGLGEKWQLEEIRVKLHAAMAALHGTIDCVANLQKAHPVLFSDQNLGNIESVVTEHSKAAYEHGGWELPRDKPLTSTGAQMSIQYAAAVQLLDGQVLMDQYGAEKLNRQSLRELTEKIRPTHNEEFDKSKITGWRTVMTVSFTDGTKVREQVEAPRGIRPPVTNDEVSDKWRRLTKDVLDDERRSAIEKCVLSLEGVSDVRELAKLLSGTVRCPIDVVDSS